VGVYLPGRFCLLHGIQVDFSNPAYVGDWLTVKAEIVHLNDAFRRIEIKASIENGTQVISKAKIRVGLNER
jgi:3-hydroxybutyryl-CoA dehydratase